jgi:hypothetical protein
LRPCYPFQYFPALSASPLHAHQACRPSQPTDEAILEETGCWLDRVHHHGCRSGFMAASTEITFPSTEIVPHP